MDMQDFIFELDKLDSGIESFNTYMHNNLNHCFIMIAERGDTVMMLISI